MCPSLLPAPPPTLQGLRTWTKHPCSVPFLVFALFCGLFCILCYVSNDTDSNIKSKNVLVRSQTLNDMSPFASRNGQPLRIFRRISRQDACRYRFPARCFTCARARGYKNMDNGMTVGKAFTSSCCSVPEAVHHKTR